MTLSIMTFIVMTLSIRQTLNIITISIMTFIIMTLSITTDKM
jgi:hypothetical protein